jgi:DNA transposition AAA+ family ATPase
MDAVKLTTENQNEVQKSKWSSDELLRLQEALQEASLVKSQNQLATLIGVNAGVLSFVKNAKWENLSDEMIARLRAYFRLNDWKLRATPNFLKIKALCEDAKANSRFLAIGGYTGAGKTIGLRRFCDTNEDAFYVLATAVMTRRGLIDAILQAMSLIEGGTIEDKLRKITDKLNRCINAVLVIDDAGKLSDSCMQLLQIIYDMTEHNAGIVVAGTEFLKKSIDKKAAKDKLGYRELKRRIAYWLPLQQPGRIEVVSFCNDYGIKDKNALDYVVKLVQDYGTLANLLMNAKMRSDKDNVAINRELLMSLSVGEDHYLNG